MEGLARAGYRAALVVGGPHVRVHPKTWVRAGALAALAVAWAVAPLGGLCADGVGDPAPDVRPRPPEPPPPEAVVADWDVDHLGVDAGLGPPPPRLDPFPLRHIRYRPDTELTSVTALELEARRVPQWVDVVERRDLVEWRPFELGHHFARLPNATVGDGGSPFLQIPGLRGFGGDRVKVLTDGIWPAQQALGFFGTSLSLWDPDTIERMEVYHGPGAFLRAVDAPGGMVNLVTRRPRRHGTFSSDVSFNTAYSSAEERWRNRAEIDVGSGRWAALGGFTYLDTGDRDTGGGTLTPSDYRSFAADVALDYFLTNRSRIGVTAQYVKAEDIASPLAIGNSVNQPGYDRFFLALSLTSFDGGSFFHGTRASISLDAFLSDDDRVLGDTESSLNGESDVSRFDLHLEGQLNLFCCHTTYAELTVGYGKLDRTETLLCVPPEVLPDQAGVPADVLTMERFIGRGADWAVIGDCVQATNTFEAEEWAATAILQDECHNARWDWMGGLRVDFYAIDDSRAGGSDTTEVLVSGAAGLAHHVTQRLTVFGNASAGWRRPTIFELNATEVVDGNVLFGNPDLDPEFHANLEVGTKMAMKDRWSFQAALFGHYTDDFIGPVTLFPGTDQQLMNEGDALLLGCELAGSWRPNTTIEGWELLATLGTTQSTDEDVVASVPVKWRTAVRYSVPQPQGYRVRRWFGELSLYGAGDSTDGLRGGDAYVTADLIFGTGVDLRCGRGAWIHLGATNLFDEDYTQATSLLAAPGLSFFVNAAIDF
jgi:outer membrane receptor protein involved in Fe transport